MELLILGEEKREIPYSMNDKNSSKEFKNGHFQKKKKTVRISKKLKTPQVKPGFVDGQRFPNGRPFAAGGA